MEILDKADIGVFGGSGFYSFLENIEEVKVDTPYGKTSDIIDTVWQRVIVYLLEKSATIE